MVHGTMHFVHGAEKIMVTSRFQTFYIPAKGNQEEA